MRKETQSKETICVFCKKPITKQERPSVRVENGEEVHIRCWNNYELTLQKKPN